MNNKVNRALVAKKKFKLFLVFMLLMTGLIPVFGSSSAHFYAKKTSGSPAGSGKIYVKRGGGDNLSPYDQLIMPNETDWKSADSQFDAGECEMNDSGKDADGYKYIDNNNSGSSNKTKGALHMYFFAKPMPGYQFDGWYDNEAGTGSKLTGSVDHYPYPGKQYTGASSAAPSKPAKYKETDYSAYISRWNNGDPTKTPNGTGTWGEGDDMFYYMRHVEILNNGDDKDITKYAKFSVKPRAFVLGGTGFDDVSYEATGYGTVGQDQVTANNISGDITLTLNYDPEKYNFNGWYYAEGSFTGEKKSISTESPATYTFVAARGLTDATKVHIWPDIKRKINPLAVVTYNNSTPSDEFESWAEAIAAAKATGVSGATITLYKDVEGITEAQEIDRDMTLNLNGHTFSGTANYLFTVKGSETDFTITNGSSVTQGQISFSTSSVQYSYAIGVQSGSKLILQSGKVYANNTKSDGSSRGIEIQSGASLEMTGGSVEAQSLQQAYAIINRGTATISGGDLYAHTTTAATAVAYLNNGTTTEISGGTFRAYAKTTIAYGIQQNVANTLTITDATVRAEAATNTAYALVRSNSDNKCIIEVNGGKYNAVAPSTVAAVNVTNKAQITLKGGIYRTNTSIGSCCHSDYGCYELNRGANWDEGYRYEVLPKTQARNFRVEADGVSNYFTSFADLNTFINESSSPIINIFLIVPEYTVPVGNYTIPSVGALVVPYDFDCSVKTTDPEHPYTSPGTPSLYRKLILADGANITVNGGGYISVGGTSQGGQPYGGCVYGPYGQIDMKSGSTITLNSGASLYCWGFITGSGEITAKSGSSVYEDFQIACWRGGSAGSSSTFSDKEVFPLAQYYIQNVEAKLHLQSGASEYVWTAVSANKATQRPSSAIQLIGSSAGLFRVTSGTLTKWYDPTYDRQMYELEGNMSLASMSMSFASVITINTSDYVLPLTNNMDITIKSGTMSCNEKVAILPGAKITINEGATVSMGSSGELYVYDKDEWPNDGASAFNYPSKSFNKVNYTPTSITNPRTYAKMNDAIMDINGTFTTASGHFYTTAGKANISSSNGTGMVVFTKAAGTNTATYQCTQDGTSVSAVSIPITPAQLHNEDGSYSATAGAKANDFYQYCGDTWKKGGCINYYTVTWKSEDGNTTLETDENVAEGSPTSFDKADPTKTSTAEYTYTFDGWTTEANGGGDFYAKGATPAASADATYYAHFSQTPVSYTLSWVTDGDALTGDYTHGSVAYGATIDAPSTPTKTGYTFAAWTPTPAATMPAANTTYTATWTPKPYTITFNSNGGSEVASITQGYETPVSAPADPTKTGYDFAGWAPAVPSTMPLNGTTCVALWTLHNYTISYNLDGGSVTPADANPTSYTVESAAITLNNPTKSGYTFDGWTGTGLSGATATVTIAAGSTGDRSYTATWHIASSDVLEVGETQEKQITINTSETVTTTIVHADGKLNIEYGKTLTTTELILEASESTSGEIIRGENASGEFAGGIDVPSNAYFDLTHTGGFKARTWYAVAVPWEVFVPTGALGGVYLKKGELEPVQQTLGTTFDLIFYDGERRAAGENKAWTYVEDYYADHTNKYPVMEPGVAYMIYLTSDADVIRFKKRTNAPCHTDGLQVTEHDSPIKADKHWNGIANPATYHARIDLSGAGVGFGQVYSNPIEQLYSVFDLSEKLVVGQPVFVQVPVTSSVAVSTPSLARRRAKEQVSITRYDLMLAASDADVTDRVIVRMDENKTENEYVIGQDLVKMGVSNKAPQMWINRYGEKMCVNTVAGFDNTADYPLGIFAPKNGEYDLFIDDQPNDETMLYLTYDGEAIWNLSYGPYVASLEKGTNTHYGLRIAKKAPQITTGIEETTVQNGEAIRKVLVNDKVYIIRNGEIYSVTGQKAK